MKSDAKRLRLFADSNVFIEGLFLPGSAATGLIRLVAEGAFELTTSQQVIEDVENAILSKLEKAPELLAVVLEKWETLVKQTRLLILPDSSRELVKKTYHQYMSSMRHTADIPILAAALQHKPDYILSGNRRHFNNEVARRCGIRMFSCIEFVQSLAH